MDLQQQVKQAFEQRYGEQATYVVRAPGRVNLIGEHTDYNDGFVLPLAIDRALWIALRPRQDHRVALYSLDLEAKTEFRIDILQLGDKDGGWAEYVKGIAWGLQEAGYGLQGWEGVMQGNVPHSAGLSSSAALELAVARAFAIVSDLPWDAANMAQMAQKAENQWVGVNCGIMDQLISAAGQADHALLIDCRLLETEPVPLPPATAIVVLDTATRRELVDSAYNERRTQCNAAADFFHVPALRDVTLEHFEAHANQLDDITRRRARHVISENERTLAAADAMRKAEPIRLGQLMNASHISLRDDFEVSNQALDIMVECAQAESGCYGARMTGAGFGGCAVALVEADRAPKFAYKVAEAYHKRTGLTPNIYLCTASDGANIIEKRKRGEQ